MAKLTFIETDNSITMASTPGITGGLVVVSKKGPVGRPVFVSNYDSYKERFGIPDPSKSVTPYAAMIYLQGSSNLYISRAIHTAPEGSREDDSNRTARFSACLLRGLVNPVPQGDVPSDFIPDRIVEPIVTDDGFGLRQNDIDKYQFPLYPTDREYVELKAKLSFDIEDSKTIVVTSLDELETGKKLSFGDSPNNSSTYFTVIECKEVEVPLRKIVLDRPMEVSKGMTARRVVITKKPFDNKVSVLPFPKKGSGLDKVLNTRRTKGQDETDDTTQENIPSKDYEYQAGTQVIVVNNITGLKSGQTVGFGNSKKSYIIQSVDRDFNTVTFRTPLSEPVKSGVEVFLHERDYKEYEEVPVTIRKQAPTTEVLVENIDFVAEGDIITFMPGLTNHETEFTVVGKGVYRENQKQVLLDKEVTVEKKSKINLMVRSEFEMKDALLIYADNQGEWGNELTVEVTKSVDYPDIARVIKVYYKGVCVGSHEVTFEPFVDGLGKQLYVEDVINNESAHIKVIHNKNLLDYNGKVRMPLINNYAIWRELPEDVFTDSGATLMETVTLEETDIKVSPDAKFSLGDRIKFGPFQDEYKVTGTSIIEVDGIQEFHLTIDRGIVVDSIPMGSEITKYSYSQAKPLVKLEQSYKDVKKNSIFKIGDQLGRMVDPGCALFEGGNDGSTPTIGDMIKALKVFQSREALNVNQIMTGGIFSPAYAKEVENLCRTREDAFAYLSNDPSTLSNPDAVQAVINFRQKLGINSSYASLDSDWVYVYCSDNQKEVLVSMDAFSAVLQTLSSKSGVWGFVTAGWRRGKVNGAMRSFKEWNEAERELLLQSQINPLKVKPNKGLSLWGNKTLYSSRSKLQQRNVRMILMQLNIQLREFLEDMQWEFNDVSARMEVCSKIQNSLNNEYIAVLEESKVMDTTTNSDVNNNKAKYYVGLIPKGVQEDIEVTIGLFSSGSTIQAI